MDEKFVAEQLRKLGPQWGVSVRKDKAKLRCPFHKDGKERTPSCNLFLPQGNFYCFGCKEKGNWNKIAAILKLESSDGSFKPNKTADIINKEEAARLLADDSDENSEKTVLQDIKRSLKWDKKTKWRSISGKLIRDIGGVLYFDSREDDTKLFLPVRVEGVLRGGIKCRLQKKNDGFDYINHPANQAWAARYGLFPYDYVKKKLDKEKHRVVVLTEGPRDALNLLQNGILAVASLGAYVIPEKLNLVMELEPDLVVLAFDPDDPGKDATDKAVEILKLKVPIMKLKMKYYEEWSITKKKFIRHKKEDPGDFTSIRCKKVKKLMDKKVKKKGGL